MPKFTVIISTIGRIPFMAAPIPAPVKPNFRQRRIADSLRAKFREQPVGDRIAATVPPNILAHEETRGSRDIASRIPAARHRDRSAPTFPYEAPVTSRCRSMRLFRVNVTGEMLHRFPCSGLGACFRRVDLGVDIV